MQGVVYWQPPESATNKIERIIREPAVSRYGSDDGLLEHCEALLEKVNSLFLNWEMRTRFWIRGNLLLVGKFSERFTIKVETFWKIYYKSWNFLIQFPPSWHLPTLSQNTSRWPSIKTFWLFPEGNRNQYAKCHSPIITQMLIKLTHRVDTKISIDTYWNIRKLN